MENSFNLNGFDYQVKINGLDVEFLLDYPERFKLDSDLLYKYYSLKEHNVDSILKNYIYACHPKELNDFYDLSGVLIDYSKVSEDQIRNFISNHDSSFLNNNAVNRDVLESYYDSLVQIIKFGKFGTTSFSKRFDNILMWSYYGNHKGFCVGYRYSLFPKSNLFGPFPINYCRKLSKIDFTKYSEPLCFHYQTNAKFKSWAHEQEYRYLAFNNIGLYDPDYLNNDKEKRKHIVDLKATKEVILGYDFFHLNELNDNIVTFNTQISEGYLKTIFIEYNNKQDIDCYHLFYNKNKYKLAKRRIRFIQINTSDFRIEYDDKIHYYKK